MTAFEPERPEAESLAPGPKSPSDGAASDRQLLRASAAHVFVDDLAEPRLSPDDRHHLERVLRLRAGSDITASDGRGAWRTVRLGAELTPLGAIRAHSASDPPLTVGFALLKGERNEWVVQKLTELGIDEVLPLAAERSVVRWDGERAARHVARLERVAREAAMQSRRVRLPTIGPVTTVDALAGRPGAALAEPDGSALDRRHRCVLVGPEGGWSPAERSGRPAVRLGPTVLRAETAAIVAGALLAALRDGAIAPAR